MGTFCLCACVFDLWNIFQLSKTSQKQTQMWEQKRELSVSSLCVFQMEFYAVNLSLILWLLNIKHVLHFGPKQGFLQWESILAYIPILTQDVGAACYRLLHQFCRCKLKTAKPSPTLAGLWCDHAVTLCVSIRIFYSMLCEIKLCMQFNISEMFHIIEIYINCTWKVYYIMFPRNVDSWWQLSWLT